jgi:hypothetical protein
MRRSIFAGGIAALVSSCGPVTEGSDSTTAGVQDIRPCESLSSPVPNAMAVRARYGGFVMDLPSSSRRTFVQADEPRGETWTDGTGFNVSYRVHSRTFSGFRVRADAVHPEECEEVIGGKTVSIQLFYSETTFVPGQYAVGSWHLTGGKTLVVEAVSPDSLRRSQLLGMLRSIRFER